MQMFKTNEKNNHSEKKCVKMFYDIYFKTLFQIFDDKILYEKVCR